jgi:tRNA (guanosine-2'-O-)-methyltransferase
LTDHDPVSSTLRTLLTDERSQLLDSVLSKRLHGLTVLLEDVHTPQNMSACIRTLESYGIQNVHVVELRDPFVISHKTTQGCHKWVDVHRHATTHDAIATLRESGYRIVVSSLEATQTLNEFDFSIPTALCFGNEKDGISQELEALADAHYRIPMHGFSHSFNLSVALAISVHEASNARKASLGVETDLTSEQAQSLYERWSRLGIKDSDRIVDALSSHKKHP